MATEQDTQMRLMAFNAMRMLPNDTIIKMYENASKQNAQGKSKKFMIRFLLDSGKMKIMTDEDDGEDKKKEITQKAKADMIVGVLMKLQSTFSVTSDDYTTTESVRGIYTRVFEDKPDDVVPYFKPDFMDNVSNFLDASGQAMRDGVPEKEVANIIIDGYKDLFILLPILHQDAILGTIDMCANNFRERMGKSLNAAHSVLEFISAKYEYEGQDYEKFAGKFSLPSTEIAEVSCDDVDLNQTEDDCPDTPLVNSHIPDIEEAPSSEAIPPAPEPIVIVVTDEEEKKSIKTNTGTLMFPGEYKRIQHMYIKAPTWNKLKKTHNLKGRWNIFIKTNPADSNPKQNKNIKYKTGHLADPDWEGVYQENGFVFSDHPYGDLYLVQ